jgi:hypothetical protein
MHCLLSSMSFPGYNLPGLKKSIGPLHTDPVTLALQNHKGDLQLSSSSRFDNTHLAGVVDIVYWLPMIVPSITASDDQEIH